MARCDKGFRSVTGKTLHQRQQCAKLWWDREDSSGDSDILGLQQHSPSTTTSTSHLETLYANMRPHISKRMTRKPSHPTQTQQCMLLTQHSITGPSDQPMDKSDSSDYRSSSIDRSPTRSTKSSHDKPRRHVHPLSQSYLEIHQKRVFASHTQIITTSPPTPPRAREQILTSLHDLEREEAKGRDMLLELEGTSWELLQTQLQHFKDMKTNTAQHTTSRSQHQSHPHTKHTSSGTPTPQPQQREREKDKEELDRPSISESNTTTTTTTIEGKIHSTCAYPTSATTGKAEVAPFGNPPSFQLFRRKYGGPPLPSHLFSPTSMSTCSSFALSATTGETFSSPPKHLVLPSPLSRGTQQQHQSGSSSMVATVGDSSGIGGQVSFQHQPHNTLNLSADTFASADVPEGMPPPPPPTTATAIGPTHSLHHTHPAALFAVAQSLYPYYGNTLNNSHPSTTVMPHQQFLAPTQHTHQPPTATTQLVEKRDQEHHIHVHVHTDGNGSRRHSHTHGDKSGRKQRETHTTQPASGGGHSQTRSRSLPHYSANTSSSPSRQNNNNNIHMSNPTGNITTAAADHNTTVSWHIPLVKQVATNKVSPPKGQQQQHASSKYSCTPSSTNSVSYVTTSDSTDESHTIVDSTSRTCSPTGSSNRVSPKPRPPPAPPVAWPPYSGTPKKGGDADVSPKWEHPCTPPHVQTEQTNNINPVHTLMWSGLPSPHTWPTAVAGLTSCDDDSLLVDENEGHQRGIAPHLQRPTGRHPSTPPTGKLHPSRYSYLVQPQTTKQHSMQPRYAPLRNPSVFTALTPELYDVNQLLPNTNFYEQTEMFNDVPQSTGWRQQSDPTVSHLLAGQSTVIATGEVGEWCAESISSQESISQTLATLATAMTGGRKAVTDVLKNRCKQQDNTLTYRTTPPHQHSNNICDQPHLAGRISETSHPLTQSSPTPTEEAIPVSLFQQSVSIPTTILHGLRNQQMTINSNLPDGRDGGESESDSSIILPRRYYMFHHKTVAVENQQTTQLHYSNQSPILPNNHNALIIRPHQTTGTPGLINEAPYQSNNSSPTNVPRLRTRVIQPPPPPHPHQESGCVSPLEEYASPVASPTPHSPPAQLAVDRALPQQEQQSGKSRNDTFAGLHNDMCSPTTITSTVTGSTTTSVTAVDNGPPPEHAASPTLRGGNLNGVYMSCGEKESGFALVAPPATNITSLVDLINPLPPVAPSWQPPMNDTDAKWMSTYDSSCGSVSEKQAAGVVATAVAGLTSMENWMPGSCGSYNTLPGGDPNDHRKRISPNNERSGSTTDTVSSTPGAFTSWAALKSAEGRSSTASSQQHTSSSGHGRTEGNFRGSPVIRASSTSSSSSEHRTTSRSASEYNPDVYSHNESMDSKAEDPSALSAEAGASQSLIPSNPTLTDNSQILVSSSVVSYENASASSVSMHNATTDNTTLQELQLAVLCNESMVAITQLQELERYEHESRDTIFSMQQVAVDEIAQLWYKCRTEARHSAVVMDAIVMNEEHSRILIANEWDSCCYLWKLQRLEWSESDERTSIESNYLQIFDQLQKFESVHHSHAIDSTMLQLISSEQVTRRGIEIQYQHIILEMQQVLTNLHSDVSQWLYTCGAFAHESMCMRRLVEDEEHRARFKLQHEFGNTLKRQKQKTHIYTKETNARKLLYTIEANCWKDIEATLQVLVKLRGQNHMVIWESEERSRLVLWEAQKRKEYISQFQIDILCLSEYLCRYNVEWEYQRVILNELKRSGGQTAWIEGIDNFKKTEEAARQECENVEKTGRARLCRVFVAQRVALEACQIVVEERRKRASIEKREERRRTKLYVEFYTAIVRGWEADVALMLVDEEDDRRSLINTLEDAHWRKVMKEHTKFVVGVEVYAQERRQRRLITLSEQSQRNDLWNRSEQVELTQRESESRKKLDSLWEMQMDHYASLKNRHKLGWETHRLRTVVNCTREKQVVVDEYTQGRVDITKLEIQERQSIERQFQDDLPDTDTKLMDLQDTEAKERSLLQVNILHQVKAQFNQFEQTLHSISIRELQYRVQRTQLFRVEEKGRCSIEEQQQRVISELVKLKYQMLEGGYASCSTNSSSKWVKQPINPSGGTRRKSCCYCGNRIRNSAYDYCEEHSNTSTMSVSPILEARRTEGHVRQTQPSRATDSGTVTTALTTSSTDDDDGVTPTTTITNTAGSYMHTPTASSGVSCSPSDDGTYTNLFTPSTVMCSPLPNVTTNPSRSHQFKTPPPHKNVSPTTKRASHNTHHSNRAANNISPLSQLSTHDAIASGVSSTTTPPPPPTLTPTPPPPPISETEDGSPPPPPPTPSLTSSESRSSQSNSSSRGHKKGNSTRTGSPTLNRLCKETGSVTNYINSASTTRSNTPQFHSTHDMPDVIIANDDVHSKATLNQILADHKKSLVSTRNQGSSPIIISNESRQNTSGNTSRSSSRGANQSTCNQQQPGISEDGSRLSDSMQQQPVYVLLLPNMSYTNPQSSASAPYGGQVAEGSNVQQNPVRGNSSSILEIGNDLMNVNLGGLIGQFSHHQPTNETITSTPIQPTGEDLLTSDTTTVTLLTTSGTLQDTSIPSTQPKLSLPAPIVKKRDCGRNTNMPLVLTGNVQTNCTETPTRCTTQHTRSPFPSPPLSVASSLLLSQGYHHQQQQHVDGQHSDSCVTISTLSDSAYISNDDSFMSHQSLNLLMDEHAKDRKVVAGSQNGSRISDHSSSSNPTLPTSSIESPSGTSLMSLSPCRSDLSWTGLGTYFPPPASFNLAKWKENNKKKKKRERREKETQQAQQPLASQLQHEHEQRIARLVARETDEKLALLDEEVRAWHYTMWVCDMRLSGHDISREERDQRYALENGALSALAVLHQTWEAGRAFRSAGIFLDVTPQVYTPYIHPPRHGGRNPPRQPQHTETTTTSVHQRSSLSSTSDDTLENGAQTTCMTITHRRSFSASTENSNTTPPHVLATPPIIATLQSGRHQQPSVTPPLDSINTSFLNIDPTAVRYTNGGSQDQQLLNNLRVSYNNGANTSTTGSTGASPLPLVAHHLEEPTTTPPPLQTFLAIMHTTHRRTRNLSQGSDGSSVGQRSLTPPE